MQQDGGVLQSKILIQRELVVERQFDAHIKNARIDLMIDLERHG
jgi:hypothetical protein